MAGQTFLSAHFSAAKSISPFNQVQLPQPSLLIVVFLEDIFPRGFVANIWISLGDCIRIDLLEVTSIFHLKQTHIKTSWTWMLGQLMGGGGRTGDRETHM